MTNGFNKVDTFIQAHNLYACLTCKQCQLVCPMSTDTQGVQFVDLVQSLRTYGYEKQLVNSQLEENNTNDFMMQIHPRIQREPEAKVNSVDFIREDTSLKIADTGDVGLFLGCSAVMENVFSSYFSQSKLY